MIKLVIFLWMMINTNCRYIIESDELTYLFQASIITNIQNKRSIKFLKFISRIILITLLPWLYNMQPFSRGVVARVVFPFMVFLSSPS